jgi:hypothetical protein
MKMHGSPAYVLSPWMEWKISVRLSVVGIFHGEKIGLRGKIKTANDNDGIDSTTESTEGTEEIEKK